MTGKKTALTLTVFLLTSCSGLSVVGYLDDHPEFSPITPRKGKSEVQIVWSRSWKPTIYLRATLVQDQFGDGKAAYVYYSITNKQIKTLDKKKISIADWNSIVRTVDDSSFWNDNSKCNELAYTERSIYFETDNDNECEEISMTDGAEITVAISHEGKSKGITQVCGDWDKCPPFGDIAVSILKAIGKEKAAN